MAQPTLTLKIADDGSEWTHELVVFAANNMVNYTNGAPAANSGSVVIEDKDHYVEYRLTASGNVIGDAKEKRPTGKPPKPDPVVVVVPPEPAVIVEPTPAPAPDLKVVDGV